MKKGGNFFSLFLLCIKKQLYLRPLWNFIKQIPP